MKTENQMMLARRLNLTNIPPTRSIELSSQIMVRAGTSNKIGGVSVGEIGMVIDYHHGWAIIFSRGQLGSVYPSLELLLRNEISRGEFEFFHIEIINK
jgi:hypothetical protein